MPRIRDLMEMKEKKKKKWMANMNEQEVNKNYVQIFNKFSCLLSSVFCCCEKLFGNIILPIGFYQKISLENEHKKDEKGILYVPALHLRFPYDII